MKKLRRDVYDLACHVEDLTSVIAGLSERLEALTGKVDGVIDVQSRIGAALGTLVVKIGQREERDELEEIRRAQADTREVAHEFLGGVGTPVEVPAPSSNCIADEGPF